MAIRGIAVNGAAIRNTRKLLGLGATAFAAEIGVPYSSLANIENGHRPTVPPELFRKIHEALRLDDPRVIMRFESVEEAIERLVEEAPPLTDYQKSVLQSLIEKE